MGLQSVFKEYDEIILDIDPISIPLDHWKKYILRH